MSDASTYGAYSAYMCVFFGVLAVLPNKLPGRWLFLFISLLSFYGMMLSGSRGPLAIIGVGGMVYLIVKTSGHCLGRCSCGWRFVRVS